MIYFLLLILISGCTKCIPFEHIIRYNEHSQMTDITGKRRYFIQNREYLGCEVDTLHSDEVNKEEYDK